MKAKSEHKATISRKIWVWTNSLDDVLDANQAFDATVIYVYPNGDVSVVGHTHTGCSLYYERLEVRDPEDNINDPDHHNVFGLNPYCTWMPYQKKVMDTATTGETK